MPACLHASVTKDSWSLWEIFSLIRCCKPNEQGCVPAGAPHQRHDGHIIIQTHIKSTWGVCAASFRHCGSQNKQFEERRGRHEREGRRCETEQTTKKNPKRKIAEDDTTRNHRETQRQQKSVHQSHPAAHPPSSTDEGQSSQVQLSHSAQGFK